MQASLRTSAFKSATVARVLSMAVRPWMGRELVAPFMAALALSLRPVAASLALEPNSELLEDSASAREGGSAADATD